MRLEVVLCALAVVSSFARSQEHDERVLLCGQSVRFWMEELTSGNPARVRLAGRALIELGPEHARASHTIAGFISEAEDVDARPLGPLTRVLLSLARVGQVPDAAVPRLRALLRKPDFRITSAYLIWRATRDDSQGWPELIGLLESGDYHKSEALLLLRHAGEDALPSAAAVATCLSDRRLRGMAAQTLAAIGAEGYIAKVRKALAMENDPVTRAELACALWRMGERPDDLLTTVRTGLAHEDAAVRVPVAAVLAEAGLGDAAAPFVEQLRACLKRGEGRFRGPVEALGSIGRKAAPAVDDILAVLGDVRCGVDRQCACVVALGRIGVGTPAVSAAIRAVRRDYPDPVTAYFCDEALRNLAESDRDDTAPHNNNDDDRSDALEVKTTPHDPPKEDDSPPPYEPLPSCSGTLRCRSSGSMNRLVGTWCSNFKRIYPQVEIVLDDAWFEDVSKEDASVFGPWLGEMKEPAKGWFEEHFGSRPLDVPVCFYSLGAFVVQDHPCRQITLRDLEKAFSSSYWNVQWGDLGCAEEKWKERPLRLCAPRRRAGQLLRARCDELFSFKDSVARHRDHADAIKAISRDMGTLSLALLTSRVDGVRPLDILGRDAAEYTPATPENVRDGSYPLAELFFLTLNHDLDNGPLDTVRHEFIRYVLSREGQAAATDAGYVALSREQARQVLTSCWAGPPRAAKLLTEQLRSRRLTSAILKSRKDIERAMRKVDRLSTPQNVQDLSERLTRTGLLSEATVECSDKDPRGPATVKFQRVGASNVATSQRSRKVVTVPLGVYRIWVERAGVPTSSTRALFVLVMESERIRLWESRP